jgi:hypothetical protein
MVAAERRAVSNSWSTTGASRDERLAPDSTRRGHSGFFGADVTRRERGASMVCLNGKKIV